MATNSIVGAPSTINPQPQSRLLSISGETRQLILQHAVPSNTHLILDPASRPGIHDGEPQRVSYGSTAALLRVSKQIYQEAVPLLYSRNIPTIMTPIEYGMLDLYLSTEALGSIKKLEARVDSGLVEIGRIWDCLIRVLPSTTELVLNLNCCSDILKPMGELMWRARKDQSFTLRLAVGDVALARNTDFLDVTNEDVDVGLGCGVLQALMYDLKPAPQLKTITVEASRLAGAWQTIVDYQHNRMDRRFNKDGHPDTNKARYLVWGEKVIVT